MALLFTFSFAASSEAQQKRSLGASKSLEPHSLPAYDGSWNDVSGFFDGDVSASASAAANLSGDCIDGLAAGLYPCDEVDLLGFLPSTTFVPWVDGPVNPNDIWGWTDPQTGREYALMGMSDGTVFVDVTVPSAPLYLGKLMTQTISRPWRDVKVYDNHAFIVADGAGLHGMQIFDLTELRNVPAPPVVFSPAALYTGFGSAHNIVINEQTGMAFAVGANSGGITCGGGLHMIDVSTPTAPVFKGCFQDTATGRRGTGYTHDAQCITYDGPDVRYTGQEICFGANETALSISNVTDPANPVALSNASYPGVVYAHQGWLTEDRSFFFQNDELDERAGIFACFDTCAAGDDACRNACVESADTRTLIWDVKQLDDPVLAGFMDIGTISVDHNLYVKGNTLIESNYQSGVRFFDVSNPVSPVPKGFFDVYPDDDRANFGGSWSNYPYFESGNIIATGRPDGLFILRHDPDPDADGDGVIDANDLCPATSIPESSPEGGLKPNRWILLDEDHLFDTVTAGRAWVPEYSTAYTGGCSCEQVVDALGLGKGHAKFGCSSSVLDDWGTYVQTGVLPVGKSGYVSSDNSDVPASFELKGNYPNPFNPETTISFGLPEATNVQLVVYDLQGREVVVLVDGSLSAGTHSVRFDASGLPSGTYVYRLSGGDVVKTGQMVLMK